MLGFVPGLPLATSSSRADRQIEVPKYVRPRTDTPELAFGWGGASRPSTPFRARAATSCSASRPAPVLDPAQGHPDFHETIVFPVSGGHPALSARSTATEYDGPRAGRERALPLRHRAVEFSRRPSRRPRGRHRRSGLLDQDAPDWRLRVHVKPGGLPTTVQDDGRPGVTASGCRPRARWTSSPTASATCSSATPPGGVSLEITYIGPKLEFTDDAMSRSPARSRRAASTASRSRRGRSSASGRATC